MNSICAQSKKIVEKDTLHKKINPLQYNYQEEGGGRMEEMTEKERKDTKMATLYELRLLFAQGDKEQYTKDEIVELLDKIATAKEQE